MSKTIEVSPSAAGKGEPSAPSPDEIRAELHSLLLSHSFHGSKRCQQFIEFVCLEYLNGRQENLKERYLAVEIFGRAPESDFSEDTIVRVGAREVRKRLAQHYASEGGASAAVRISLPPGSYVPEFRYQSQTVEPVVPVAPAPPVPVEEIAPVPIAVRRISGPFLWWGAVAVAVVMALALGVWLLSNRNPNRVAFDRFWEPVMRSHDPLLIAVAHPIIYFPTRHAVQLSEENQPPAELLGQRPIKVSPNRLDGSDFVPVVNQFVGFGDLEVSTEVAAMLAQRSKAVRVRMASSVEFADLRNVQTLLVGAITNRWTVQLQSGWRYQFARNLDSVTYITDTHPSGEQPRQWSIPSKDDGSTPEDYIMLCRVRRSETNGFLLVAAGLKQFGTEAAAHLLTDPEQLGSILRELPTGWENKDLQMIFHARVIGNTPARPDLVAWNAW